MTSSAGELVDAVTALAGTLEHTAFPLPAPSAQAAEGQRRDLLGQLADYLLPRLRRLDAPLLAVVGGSTGAGKSTLINSLIGDEVTTPGVLRPTTRDPVCICHPKDAAWFTDGRILPGLARTGGPGELGGLRIVLHEGVGPGLALLDAPDIDSVVTANRELASTLLAAADLWIFLTTAARYADAVPWQLLQTARERGTAVAVVLDRCPPAAMNDVGGHLAAMLAARGLGGAPLFVLPEESLRKGRLHERTVAPLRRWLSDLNGDVEARSAVVRYTLDGALRTLAPRTHALALSADEQAAVRGQLDACVTSSYGAARERVDESIRDGALLRGEVLARWQDVVGTGELLRRLESRIGRLRDRFTSAVTGRTTPVDQLENALESGIVTVIRAAADDAAENAHACWSRHPAGAPLLTPELSRPAIETATIETLVRDWQGAVLELVRNEGESKRRGARLATWGVNGAGLVVMLAVFSQTAGLSGAEVAVAGGTSAASHKVLEAMFGDQAVRTLARKAREELLVRVGALLDADADRFRSRLGGHTVDGSALRDAAERVHRALAVPS